MGHNVGHWVIGYRSLSSYGSYNYVGHLVIDIGHRSLSTYVGHWVIAISH